MRYLTELGLNSTTDKFLIKTGLSVLVCSSILIGVSSVAAQDFVVADVNQLSSVLSTRAVQDTGAVFASPAGQVTSSVVGASAPVETQLVSTPPLAPAVVQAAPAVPSFTIGAVPDVQPVVTGQQVFAGQQVIAGQPLVGSTQTVLDYSPVATAPAAQVIEETTTTILDPAQPFAQVVSASAPVTYPGADQAFVGAAPSPFSITVEGDAEVARDENGKLPDNLVDIQVQFDGLDIGKEAHITILDHDQAEAAGGNTHSFIAYWNYSAFVKQAEVRIFHATDPVGGKPLIALPVREDRVTPLELLDRTYAMQEMQYVLRIYGQNGSFDETGPQRFVIDNNGKLASGDAYDDLASAWGKNSLVVSGINVTGGAVTVRGKNIPGDHTAWAFGQRVPVDTKGAFATQEILPGGDHVVQVSVLDPVQQGVHFKRELKIPKDQYFYVALGDITLGSTATSGPASLVGESETIVEGQAAFFFKGKVRGDVLITAMADTGYGEVGEILSSLDKKDVSSLLDRVNPDKLYPVYGDDGSITENALTQGKFYVKIEKDESYVVWGNYSTNITGNDFININRGLYGAKGQFRSNAKTSFGQSQVSGTAFVAQPGTLPQRDEFRGTGGSLYWLSHQDITASSEKLSVEVRDRVTGLVLEVQELKYEDDYDIDYIQGRIILGSPLQSTINDNFITELDDGLNGNPAYLVANYEFTPGLTDVGGNVVAGGRASGWLADKIQVGVTGQYDNTTGASEATTIVGVDATARLAAGTYVKVQAAQSNGVAVATTNSVDGGLTNCNSSNSTTSDAAACDGTQQTIAGASAIGISAAANLKELGIANVAGTIGAAFERKEKGFAGAGSYADSTTQNISLTANVPIAQTNTNVKARITRTDDLDNNTNQSKVQFDVEQKFGKDIITGLGIGFSSGTNTGSKTDIGAKAGYKINEQVEVTATASTSVSATDGATSSTKIGIGANAALTENIQLASKLSYDVANQSAAASANVNYKVNDTTSVYAGYNTGFAANSTESNVLGGAFNVGAKTRFNDSLSLYVEEELKHEGTNVNGLTSAAGLEFKVSEAVSVSGSAEFGKIYDGPTSQELTRRAATAAVAYAAKGINAKAALEYRADTDDEENTLTSFLLTSSADYKVDPSWSLKAKISALLSDRNGDLQSGNYIDGEIGAAFRPVKGDRLNALLSYRFFSDLPNEESAVAANGDYRQRSHILSADANFKVNNFVTLGGRYGFKRGERTLDNESTDFYTSTTHLGIARADIHVVKNWDGLLEGRVLHNQESAQTKYGALVGVYRHIGDNFKVGGGYNFSGVTDDLTNEDANSHGWFINAIAKF